MLACLLRPTSGDATIDGHSITHDPLDVKRTIGVVPQDIAVYEDMSARENLVFWGKMYGLAGAALQAASTPCWSSSRWRTARTIA